MPEVGMFQKVIIGSLPKGQRNTIWDVGGVNIWHVTLTDGDCQTGVTAITAHDQSVGLARTGSFPGHGSGDIALAFTTADPVDTKCGKCTHSVEQIEERRIDRVFRATTEATEEAIINSMLNAKRVMGRDGNARYALGDFGNLMGDANE